MQWYPLVLREQNERDFSFWPKLCMQVHFKWIDIFAFTFLQHNVVENVGGKVEKIALEDIAVEEVPVAKLECRVCKKVFAHQSSHSQHQSLCGQQKKSKKCEKCEKVFARNDVLKKHLKICKPKLTDFCCAGKQSNFSVPLRSIRLWLPPWLQKPKCTSS